MNERGKSDNLVVPAKPPNKAGEPVAEVAGRAGREAGLVTERDDRGSCAGDRGRGADLELVRSGTCSFLCMRKERSSELVCYFARYLVNHRHSGSVLQPMGASTYLVYSSTRLGTSPVRRLRGLS